MATIPKRLGAYIRGNAIALLALFVALGGSSYAALTLPRGSVGTKQLRNGAVTPAKLNAGMIGGSVRAWAYVAADGTLYASNGFKGRVNTNSSVAGTYALFPANRDVRGCAALASVVPAKAAGLPSGPGFADANLVVFPHEPIAVGVSTFSPAGQATALPFVVEVLC